MLSFITRDDLEIIGKWSGDDLGVIEIVPRFFLMELDEGDDGLEDNEENNWTECITLEDTTVICQRWGTWNVVTSECLF